jgi:hypothetical protein
MRLLVAALLGGVVMFFWGFVSHMVLPIGEMGVHTAANEEAFLAAAKEHLGSGEGVYLVPGITGADMNDDAKAKAYSARATANPNAFVVYQPVGSDGMQMGDNLGKEFATNVACAAIVAFVLALGAFGFARRVRIAALLGLFAWLAINVPYWNWYRFPLEFTLGSAIQQVVGWTLAGAAIAWWLGRGEKAA